MAMRKNNLQTNHGEFIFLDWGIWKIFKRIAEALGKNIHLGEKANANANTIITANYRNLTRAFSALVPFSIGLRLNFFRLKKGKWMFWFTIFKVVF